MTIKKVRGFNRGKNNLDYRAIAGPTNQIGGANAISAKGARWDVVNGGTLQRVGINSATSVYPGHTSGGNGNSWIEDVGALSDYHAAGGFVMTCHSILLRSQIGYLYTTPGGTSVMNFITSTSYNDTQDFYNYSPEVPIPSIGSNVGAGWWANQTSNGEILFTNGNYVTRWDSASNPTQATTLETSSLSPRLFNRYATWHDGFYYFIGSNASSSNANGIIYRNSQFSTTGMTAVLSFSEVYQEKMDWLPAHNCFITIGATGGAEISNQVPVTGTARIFRSTDGTTWNQTFTTTTANTCLIDFITVPSTGRVIVVGASGFIVTSDDGGLTWVQRASGTTQNISCLAIAPDGTIIGITSPGNTVISTDGSTWTFVQNQVTGINLESTMGWRVFNYQGKLFAFRTGGSRYIVMSYTGDGQWEIYTAINPTNLTQTSTGVPTGTFFANPYSGTGNLTGGKAMFGANMTTSGIWVYSGTAAWSAKTQVTTTADNDWHKIQVVGNAVPMAADNLPRFQMQVFIDNALVHSDNNPMIAPATNARLWMCTSAWGFNATSDIVVTDFAGTRNVGRPDTDIQIRPRLLTTDVQAEWEKVPANIATNVQAVQGNGSVVAAPSSVQSSASNTTDVYGGDTVAPVPGYRVAAVQVETTFQRAGVPSPTVELSVTEGGSSLPAQTAVLNGSSVDYVTLTALYSTKLDGQGWTPESVSAATVQLRQSA